jgi:hypothetical protein
MSAVGQVLALDLATRTGWALGRPRDAVPQSGSVNIAPADATVDRLLSACRAWLNDFLFQNPTIHVIAFEAPLLPMHMQGKTTVQAIRKLVGLASVVRELTYTRGGYEVQEQRVSDIRTHFLGSNSHKRGDAKALTIARCNQLGWLPCDDNAADALALWDYQVGLLRQQALIRRSF